MIEIPAWVFLAIPAIFILMSIRAVKVWLRMKAIEITMKIVVECTKKGIFTEKQQEFAMQKMMNVLDLQNEMVSKGI